MTDETSKIESAPCGCTVGTAEDGTKVFAPCVPCALFRTAKLLEDASSKWNPWKFRRALHEAAHSLASVAAGAQRAASGMRAQAEIARQMRRGKK